MRPYVVRQGDYLAAIAYRLRTSPESIWEHPDNAALRKLRENPSVLYPGDVLFVPAAPPEPQTIASEQPNRYVADLPETKLHLTFRDGKEPLASAACEISGLGEPIPTSTEPDGTLEIDVPLHVSTLSIFFPTRGLVYPVLIGHLDPEGTATGVEGRLSNLGYPSDTPAPLVGDQPPSDEAMRRSAVLSFQVDHMEGADGEIDDELERRLAEVHGC